MTDLGIDFHTFDENQFLSELPTKHWGYRVSYIRQYLKHQKANLIIEEKNYFDRDFLAEFSAFYATSAHPYNNRCRRLHFFSESIVQDDFWKALGGCQSSQIKLQNCYLGFSILRPISHAPFGRTVLGYYRENSAQRNNETARPYSVHLYGIDLKITGVAWQQQDECVSACATVALWSLLNSSAFDDYHLVPTTTEITKLAQLSIPDGKGPFPSNGLNIDQIGEAIKGYGLTPVVLYGHKDIAGNDYKFFDQERFSNDCSSFIRSGYPLLLFGNFKNPHEHDADNDYHAICAVGFKEANYVPNPERKWSWQDSSVSVLYIHDDNLGPNVRFKISNDECDVVYLKPEKPNYVDGPDLFDDYQKFYPQIIVAAVHEEMRSNPEGLIEFGTDKIDLLHEALITSKDDQSIEAFMKNIEQNGGLTLTTRFIKIKQYLGNELNRLFEPGKFHPLRKTIREAIASEVEPMSLHLGLVRIGVGSSAVVDILCDTTEPFFQPFCSIAFSKNFFALLNSVEGIDGADFGFIIKGFPEHLKK